MAIGDLLTGMANLVRIELMASATATSAIPSATSDGLSMEDFRSALGGTIPDIVTLLLKSTAGSGTMTVTAKLWLMLGTAATDWVPAGTGGDTTKGTLNAGAAIGESDTDRLYHTEPIFGLHQAQRAYLQITNIGGTSTAVTAYLLAERATARAA